MWLIVLSDQLPVFGLVSRYLTNYLIGRETIPQQRTISSTDHAIQREYPVLIQVSLGYPGLGGRFLTCYAPVRRFPRRNLTEPTLLARLACIKRTANVRPEPGSNSPSKYSMSIDPASVQAQTRSVFIPQKDEAIRGRVLFVYGHWLVRPSFLLRSGRTLVDRSDGHITLTVRPPSCLVWRQAPVNLDHSPCGVRSTHCSVVKEPGSAAHSSQLASTGPHSVPLLRASSIGRPRGRQKWKVTPLAELVQLARSNAPETGRLPSSGCVQD